jgi:hypothetical protein
VVSKNADPGVTNQAEATRLGFFRSIPRNRNRLRGRVPADCLGPVARRDTRATRHWRLLAALLPKLSAVSLWVVVWVIRGVRFPIAVRKVTVRSGERGEREIVRRLWAGEVARQLPPPEIKGRLGHTVPLAPLADAHPAALLSLDQLPLLAAYSFLTDACRGQSRYGLFRIVPDQPCNTPRKVQFAERLQK